MLKYNYKITLSYDGTNYFGWQIQDNKASIQGEIQKALKKYFSKNITIIASGRTDTNVHANAQVANFNLDKKIDLKKTLYSLNSILKKDITILKIEEVSLDFHARFSCKSKVYRYYISNNLFQDPFSRNYSHNIKKKLDISLLKKALNYFIGTHDFTSFANINKTAKINPIKTIYRFDLFEKDDFIILEIEGSGFLYKMVRNIVGTILEILEKKKPLNEISIILNAKDRKKAYMPAPAKGLFLYKVNYI